MAPTDILPDENELAHTLLSGGPGLGEGALELHVNCVVDVLLLSVSDRQHSLHAVQLDTPGSSQLCKPSAHQVKVELALSDAAHVARGALVDAVAGHAGVVRDSRARQI